MVGYAAEPVIGPRYARTRWRLTAPYTVALAKLGADASRERLLLPSLFSAVTRMNKLKAPP